MENHEITKSQLINLFYDYMRLYKYSSAKLIFRKNSVDLLLKDEEYKNISRIDAYHLLSKLKAKKTGLGQGYSGRSMSVNAKKAYGRGLRPLSKITSEDLKKCRFPYSVDFFRWLVKTWHIRPREQHHTSAAYNNTNFYDDSVIVHLATQCNLELLYKIYKGELTKEQGKRERGIQYVKVRVSDTLIGGKSGRWINMNCILCEGIVFYSQKLCFRADNEKVEILKIFDTRPDTDFENKYLKNLSEKLLKNKTDFYKRYLRT